MSDAVHQRAPNQPLVPPGGMDLHARDMTATFSADCPLRFVQWKLAELGQWLPVDGSSDATLGQLVETNSTGPLRLGFGAWRDLLLGVQFTNGMGELITAGGRTVKNVAGYDLTKFMVGGHGLFGRLVTITTRTYARPEGAMLVKHDAAGGAAKLAVLLPTPLRPQWAILTHDALFCGYLGDERTLAWYEANVETSGPVKVTRRTLQEDIDHRAGIWNAPAGDRTPFRASVPPASFTTAPAFLLAPGWAVDPAFGIIVGSIDGDRGMLETFVEANRGAVRFGASAATLDVSTNPAERQIIERLKAAFDPDNRLNLLPWQRR